MVTKLSAASSRLALLFPPMRSRWLVRGLLLWSAVAGLVIALGGCAGSPLPPKAQMSPVSWTWVVPPTGSMRPEFGDYDVARCSPFDFDKLQVGMVVVRGNVVWASASGGMIFHRIIARTPYGFITRGDNCEREDPGYMTRDDFCGKVTRVARNPHPAAYRVAMGLKD